MTNVQPPPVSDPFLARGGGHAAAAGITFEAQLGSAFACQLLTERLIDSRLGLGDVRPRSLRFETEAPVDDILIETDQGGWVFVQAKTTLNLSSQSNSPLGSTVQQIVRLWLACTNGQGKRGWDRPLQESNDCMLVAIGPRSAATVSSHLAKALVSIRAAATAPLPEEQRKALDTFAEMLKRTWQEIEGQPPRDADVQRLLKFITVIVFDFEGADRTSAFEVLAHVLERPADGSSAFDVLTQRCSELMSKRLGSDAAGFRRTLLAAQISLRAAPTFVADVARLSGYSERVQTHLNQYEETKVGTARIKIHRPVIESVIRAALDDSLLLVGEPGAGKSAVVGAAAEHLRRDGHAVLELAVDRLPVESLEGLKQALELSHSVTQVLLNWPGDGPAFLFIDALDATRGGASEAVFRELIRDVLELPDGRWRVIASIRTFDLRLGQQFRELFKGAAPESSFADPSFLDVRHIHVPPWSDAELEQFLKQAPAIADAVAKGGERLRALATVPFNTRLLADLVTDGLDPTTLYHLSTQAQLLDLYWRHRVERIGTGAQLCLQASVSEMVETRALSARRLSVAKADPTAFDKLLHESVLILLRNDQYVAFRHHILFDYAASRLYLDAEDIDATAALLQRDRGLGIMLAPALAFTLQNLWNEPGAGRVQFWDAVGRICGDQGCDPIARSVAARMGAELPELPSDVDGFVSALSSDGDRNAHAIRAFGHVVGSLAVRGDDKRTIEVGPWCHLTAQAAAHAEDVLWPLRTLLYLLVERKATPEQRLELGQGARAILKSALDRLNTPSQLTAAAIDFVGATYATDIPKSRDLLRRLLEPARFEARADQEMPSLARKVRPISEADPDFAVEIYGVVFGRQITDTSKTSLGDSKILPMLSNRRQDYDMARFTLKEFFPRFLDAHPSHALTALIRAMAEYILLQHSMREPAKSWAVLAGSSQVRLKEDLSHIWAWNPNDAHADNTLGLLQAFVKKLREADVPTARAMIEQIISQNELAVIWNRTFLVGVSRAADIGDLLWPVATKEPFLLSADTRKDVIDFIAARYKFEPPAARLAFETDALRFEFSFSSEPESSRKRFLETLFGLIGVANLASAEAREFLPSDQSAPAAGERNRRPFEITSGWSRSVNSHWWFDEKVQVDAPENAPLLTEADRVKAELGLTEANKPVSDIATAIGQLQGLRDLSDASAAAHDIKAYSAGVISEAVVKISRLKLPELRIPGNALSSLVALIDYLSELPFPEPSPDAEANFEKSEGWGSPAPRVEAAESIMNLMRLGAPHVDHFRNTVERLLGDAYPPVRLQIAERLISLWEIDRDWMWRLAEQITRRETNRGVLKFFANYFLGRVVHHAPEAVERLTLALLARDFARSEAATEGLLEELGSLTALLWISHGTEAARHIIETWLADAPTFEPELNHAISVSREALVLKYTDNTPRAAEITRRAQEFASWIVATTATGLEDYLLAFKTVAPSEVEQRRGTMFAKLLNNVSDQFYFASGAFRHSQGDEPALETLAAKRTFLSDTYSTLWRIADAGTPATIHHLIELLEFLVPADPARAFDLVAHALLGSGKDHGYQFESLGADRFVTIIGRFLADHRDLFADGDRRQKLVACLDAFMEAGWPAARRLLYRLPELLQ
jgi:hypothetical protein